MYIIFVTSYKCVILIIAASIMLQAVCGHSNYLQNFNASNYLIASPIINVFFLFLLSVISAKRLNVETKFKGAFLWLPYKKTDIYHLKHVCNT